MEKEIVMLLKSWAGIDVAHHHRGERERSWLMETSGWVWLWPFQRVDIVWLTPLKSASTVLSPLSPSESRPSQHFIRTTIPPITPFLDSSFPISHSNPSQMVITYSPVQTPSLALCVLRMKSVPSLSSTGSSPLIATACTVCSCITT